MSTCEIYSKVTAGSQVCLREPLSVPYLSSGVTMESWKLMMRWLKILAVGMFMVS